MNKVNFAILQKAAFASLTHPGKAPPLPKTNKTTPPIVFLFRHTQTWDNKRRIFSGRRDSKLTPTGKCQARKLANKLADQKIDCFLISPLTRCWQTVNFVRRFHPGASILEDKRLLERDYGKLTGTSKLRLAREHPKLMVLYRRSWDVPPPGGESLKDVWQKRIRPFCRDLVSQLRAQPLNIAICCTNNTMRLIRRFFEKLTIEQTLTLENPFGDYASYSID